jgi:hypothetical protein
MQPTGRGVPSSAGGAAPDKTLRNKGLCGRPLESLQLMRNSLGGPWRGSGRSMSKHDAIRVAVGTPKAPFSGVWRFIVRNDDVYIGSSKASMGAIKFSLHASGIWVLSATEQSGLSFEGGNRRAKTWTRPLPDGSGVTRGPSILVPHTSLSARRRSLTDDSKSVTWVRAPAEAEAVEITVFFVNHRLPVTWPDGHDVIAERLLKSGVRMLLTTCIRPLPTSVALDVEQFLRSATLQTPGPSEGVATQLLWCRESGDALRTPFIFDLPVPVIGGVGAA